jgi:hypothetical protein
MSTIAYEIRGLRYGAVPPVRANLWCGSVRAGCLDPPHEDLGRRQQAEAHGVATMPAGDQPWPRFLADPPLQERDIDRPNEVNAQPQGSTQRRRRSRDGAAIATSPPRPDEHRCGPADRSWANRGEVADGTAGGEDSGLPIRARDQLRNSDGGFVDVAKEPCGAPKSGDRDDRRRHPTLLRHDLRIRRRERPRRRRYRSCRTAALGNEALRETNEVRISVRQFGTALVIAAARCRRR